MRCGWLSTRASPIDAVSSSSRSLKVIGARERAAHRVGEGGDARRLALGEQQQAELVAGKARERVLGLEQATEAAREGEQDRVADRDADGVVDLLEPIEVDHHHGRADGRIGLGERQRGVEPVEEQLAVRQSREVVVHGVVQEPLLGGLELGYVGERADEAHDLAVRADHGARLEGEPHVVAVGRAQAELQEQPAAALVKNAVERGAEAVAIERVQQFRASRRRSRRARRA